MRTNTARINFTGGEISPRLDGRTDITKHPAGCRVLENFLVMPQGGVQKRPGTQFVIEIPELAYNFYGASFRFVPFQFNVEQSYMLLFTDRRLWVFKDRALLFQSSVNNSSVTNATPRVVTTSASHGFATGDWVKVSGLGETLWRITVTGATTFTLDGSTATGSVAAGTTSRAVTLATPYVGAVDATDEIKRLQVSQINDVMYVAHKNHPLHKISRLSDTSWTLSEPLINTGPFRTINGDESFTLTPSSFSAAATAYGTHEVGETFTLTASAALFDAGHVGALFRLFEEGGETGVPSAPVSDSTQNITNGFVYTNSGNIYGISNFTTTSGTKWTGVSRVPSHESGTVRVRSGGGSKEFDANFLHPGYCVVRITAVSSATVATAEIVRYQMPQSVVTSGTSFWEEGAWSEYRGYPGSITFFEQRLILAGSTSEPTAIWGSRTGAYEDFEDGADDDDAISLRLASGRADVIQWIHGRKILMCGTSYAEYAVAASSDNEALTPSNVKAVLQTDYGTSNALPVFLNQVVLFPQRRGEPGNPARKLREFAYAFTNDKFESVDLTIFAEHIFDAALLGGTDRIAYQRDPDPTIWTRTIYGVLCACTYLRDQEIVAWHRHLLGGGNSTPFVEEIEVGAGIAGEEVWLVTQRYINGSTRYYVEFMRNTDDAILGVTGYRFLDCFKEINTGPSGASILNDLEHLANEEVVVVANGEYRNATVSSAGKINLGNDPVTGYVAVGYPYRSVLETENLEVGLQNGTSQSRLQRINTLWLRLLKSFGGKVGVVGSDETEPVALQPILYRKPTTSLQLNVDRAEKGLIESTPKFGSDRDIRVRVEHDEPYPFYLAAIIAEMDTQ